MLEKVKEIRKKLEKEKNNSKRYLLSNLYFTLFQQLSNEERKQEEKYLCQMDLILADSCFYDFLKSDNELFQEFFSKCNKKFLENDFNCYELFPNNKLNLKEAKEISYQILDDINPDKLESYNRLYCFDKIHYCDLEAYLGKCCNTFNFLDSTVFLDKNIDKQVEFICTFIHELGHEYENIFMSNMSSLQQISRYSYCFVEVMSSFLERIALDYLIKNKIYEDDAQRNINLKYYDLNYRLECLKEASDYAVNDAIIYDFENVINIEKTSDDKYKVFYYEYMNDIKYGYGALLGEYFFDIYRQDKKEGLKKIRDFLANQALLDEREMLDTIDFFENDYSFLDNGLQENMSYMRKRYKW